MLLPRFSNFSSTTSVNNILKARRAFFSLGSIFQISFQSLSNLLSTWEFIETCVKSVLLYVCESWTITDSILDQLANVKSERNLRVPYFRQLSALLALDFPPCRQESLLKLKLVSSDQDMLSQRVFSTTTATNTFHCSRMQATGRKVENNLHHPDNSG